MKNITVLVTSIGGPVAQGVLKGLNEIENIRIIGGDRRELHQVICFAIKFIHFQGLLM